MSIFYHGQALTIYFIIATFIGIRLLFSAVRYRTHIAYFATFNCRFVTYVLIGFVMMQSTTEMMNIICTACFRTAIGFILLSFMLDLSHHQTVSTIVASILMSRVSELSMSIDFFFRSRSVIGTLFIFIVRVIAKAALFSLHKILISILYCFSSLSPRIQFFPPIFLPGFGAYFLIISIIFL